jgi:hypothetical protein
VPKANRWCLSLCCAGIFLLSSPAALSQSLHSLPEHRFSIPLWKALDSVLTLPHQFIVAGSESLSVPHGRVLRRELDYQLDSRQGRLRITPDSLLAGDARADSLLMLRLSYRYIPFTFSQEYSRNTSFVIRDTLRGDTLRVVKPSAQFSMQEAFGPGLQKSGSIVRGFTIGSNRDATLTSGLRLQLSGKLSSEVEIAAALTDENTPIQPEGTTETLQEFDKVFVEIRSPSVSATLGDFNLTFGQSAFGSFNRKLQGAQATGQFQTGDFRGEATVAGASTRGKFATLQLQGIEGVQGPYRLVGRDGETAILVIAGSERVYIDGELQTRGETSDYVIDYGTGEIRFTPKRLINAASRLVIDYEYTDRQYTRSLFGARATGELLSGLGRVSLSYLREADNPDAPIDFTITDSTRKILEDAGGDRSKATISGVTRVDSGGVYVQVDTLLPGGTPRTFYRYLPGDSAAVYTVRFSSVGLGNGEYIRKAFGVFEWRGVGQGDYLPVIFLPFPEAHQVMDAVVSVAPGAGLVLQGEYAHSDLVVNRFSTEPDARRVGDAYTVDLRYAPSRIAVGGLNLGKADLFYRERFQGAGFTPMDRANEIEFTRKWGVDTLRQGDERLREFTAAYNPIDSLSLKGAYGHFARGGEQSSDRLEAGLGLFSAALPDVQYQYELIRSEDVVRDAGSRWVRQKGAASYSWWMLGPYVNYEGEDRRLEALSTGQVQQGSLRYNSVLAGLDLLGLGKLGLGAEFGWRNDEAFDGTGIAPESRSLTRTLRARLEEWENLSASGDLTLRDRDFSEALQSQGNQDIRTVLVRLRTRYVPFRRALDVDAHYEVLTERASQLQRVFVRVTPGTGNYRYLGDLNNNGIADDNEYAQTRFDGDYVARVFSVGELVPIIDLKTGLRLRFQPKRLLEGTTSTAGEILRALSTETTVRVEEKSTTSQLEDIYLLHFSRFQQDSTTITGSASFVQDLLVLEGNSLVSGRLRFQQRKGMATLVNGPERSQTGERSARLRVQPLEAIAAQFEIVGRTDQLAGEPDSPRLRDITGTTVSADLSYRPVQEIEWGIKLDGGSSTDRQTTAPTNADMNSQAVRFSYALAGRGQLSLEGTREEVRISPEATSYPYELTGGRVAGISWFWRMNFDYRLTGFLQTTVSYDGRTEAGAPVVHTARAEVRAFF